MKRKSLSESLSTPKGKAKEETNKEDKIIEKLEGKSTSLKKMTVEIPENLHTKLKVESAQRGVKIKEIIIELIEGM